MTYPIHDVRLPSALAGNTNGRLDPDDLVQVMMPGRGIANCQKEAARAWNAMSAACWVQTGVILTITSLADAYRTYAQQYQTFMSRYTTTYLAGRPSKLFQGTRYYLKPGMAEAATPGNSNHGWGLAFDLAYLTWDTQQVLAIYNSPAWNWLLANAEQYGFSWETSEPWHLRLFVGDVTTAAVLNYEAGIPLPPAPDPGQPPPDPAPVPDPIPPVEPAPAPWDPAMVTAVKPLTVKGHRNSYVLYLQQVIFYRAGGNIDMDGIFGSGTERRVMDLQAFFGLTVDGKVGKNTWATVDFLAGQ